MNFSNFEPSKFVMVETEEKLPTKKSYLDIFEKQKKFSSVLKSEPISKRGERLRKLESWILANLDRVHMAVYSDMKKPRTESDISEAYVVLGEIRKARKNLRSWTGKQYIKTPLPLFPAKGWVRYEPKGVCLIISPWNFPFNLAVAPLVSALAAGNSAIIKPSELAPATSALVDEMAKELFSEKEVTVIQGGVQLSQELIKLPFDHIFFTGSQGVGKKVLEAAAQNLTPVTLELGGKSPVIIDQSASLSDAADKIVVGKFFNCGQTCIAPDICLVHKSIEKKFLDHLLKSLEKHYPDQGNGNINRSEDYGRIVNEKHFDRLVNFYSEAISGGAVKITGGDYDKAQRYFSPTIITGLSNDMMVLKEEIFGPILPVLTYESLDDLLVEFKEKQSPLVLYVFSKRRKFVENIARATSSGAISWNDVAFYFLHHGLPFGGVRESGMGRSHGFAGFKTFSYERSYIKQRVGWIPAKLIFPPFTSMAKWITDKLLRFM